MPLHVNHVWRKCQESLASILAPQTYKTWFEPITAISLDEESDEPMLCLQVPAQFFSEWIESRYPSTITEVVDEVVGRKTQISFRVEDASVNDTDDEPTPSTQEPRRSFFEHLPPRAGELVATGGAPSLFKRRSSAHDSQLNPAYTFDSFIEGDCNRLARSASQAIAEHPGATSFNPFLVYGGVGLGKTHVAQAIGNYARAKGWQGRCLYVSSERFTSQFVHAIQENRMSAFTRYYRQIDLLIVDDVQFFGGKEKTQEEFFHIFNELHQTGRQIILLADRPPREIDGIEERLLSRFQWGLLADVQPPDLETRIAILQRKAKANHVAFSQDVLEFVAQNVKSNVRNLEGALVRLTAHAQLQRREVDCDFAADILKDLIEEKPRVVDIEYIKRVVAQYYNTDPNLLSDKTRRREIVQARQVAMYCCKQLTGQPLKTIGLRFGGRDHSTVIHACRTVENRLDVEPGFRHELDRINTELASRRSA